MADSGDAALIIAIMALAISLYNAARGTIAWFVDRKDKGREKAEALRKQEEDRLEKLATEETRRFDERRKEFRAREKAHTKNLRDAIREFIESAELERDQRDTRRTRLLKGGKNFDLIEYWDCVEQHLESGSNDEYYRDAWSQLGKLKDALRANGDVVAHLDAALHEAAQRVAREMFGSVDFARPHQADHGIDLEVFRALTWDTLISRAEGRPPPDYSLTCDGGDAAETVEDQMGSASGAHFVHFVRVHSPKMSGSILARITIPAQDQAIGPLSDNDLQQQAHATYLTHVAQDEELTRLASGLIENRRMLGSLLAALKENLYMIEKGAEAEERLEGGCGFHPKFEKDPLGRLDQATEETAKGNGDR